jgi:hypothetical protein
LLSPAHFLLLIRPENMYIDRSETEIKNGPRIPNARLNFPTFQSSETQPLGAHSLWP